MEDKLKLAMKVYRLSEAWSLEDILKQLVKATDILLKDKGYDGNTYEEMQYCSQFAKELIKEIPVILGMMAEKDKVVNEQADVIKSICEKGKHIWTYDGCDKDKELMLNKCVKCGIIVPLPMPKSLINFFITLHGL